MENYIYSIVVAGVFSAVIILLSPDGQGGKVGKYVSFIGAMSVTLVILSPLPKVFFDSELLKIPVGGVSGAVASGQIEKGEYLANLAGMTLSQIYGTEVEKIKAYVYCDDSGEIEKILLSLQDNVFYDCNEAGEVISKICEIKIEVEEYKG